MRACVRVHRAEGKRTTERPVSGHGRGTEREGEEDER